MVHVTRTLHPSRRLLPSRLVTILSSTVFVVIMLVMVVVWEDTSVENFALLRRELTVGILGTTASSTIMPSSPVPYAPFPNLKGEHYDIYHPFHRFFDNATASLLATPEVWIGKLTQRYEWLDARTHAFQGTVQERAVQTYLEMMKQHVSGVVFGDNEKSIPTDVTKPKLKVVTLRKDLRAHGLDWPYLGVTMTGRKRLENVEALIRATVKSHVEGDYVETGVWRGGNSILARATLRALDKGDRRSFVCDSFRGLPPGDKKLDEKDQGWDHAPYLEVSDDQVASNFQEAGVLDPNVVFVKGFFNETMKPLASEIDKISIMRLDGDMYESTVDVLYHLYEKLSIGGFVIVDDWDGFPSKQACLDFFAVHGLDNIKINRIDHVSVYWQKTEEVKIQYWRYEQSKFHDQDAQTG